MWYIFYRQDNVGLYTKQKNNEELHIFPKRFKVKRNENKNV